MIKIKLVLILLLSIAIEIVAYKDVSSDYLIRKELKTSIYTMFDAVMQADDDLLLKYTSPKLIELMGGKEKFYEYCVDTRKELKSFQMELVYNSLNNKITIIYDSTNYYCLFNYESYIKLPNQKYMVSNTYMMGFKSSERNWEFIAAKNNDSLKLFYPNVPNEISVPPHRRTPIVRPANEIERLINKQKSLNYYFKEEYNNAVASASYLIEVSNDNLDARFIRAKSYRELKQFKNSLVDVDYILSKFPSNVKAIYLRASLYLNLNRFNEAISDYKRLLKDDINETSVPNNIAWAMYLTKDKSLLPEALEYANKAIGIKDEYWIHGTRGRIYYELGKYELAKSDLKIYINNANDPRYEKEVKEATEILKSINEKVNN